MDRWANEAHETDAVDLDSPENLRALRRAYYGLVSYVDRKLGELLDALEDAGVAGDTAVVFTSDHGDMLAERRMVQKRTFYEWSVRVPLLVRLPDGRGAGTSVARPVSLLDLAPTLLELAGIEPPLPLDGQSLFDESERVVFSEYHVEKVRAPCLMARKGRWKYVYVHGHDERLFDLEADPGEWEDVAGEDQVRAELRAAILERFDPEQARRGRRRERPPPRADRPRDAAERHPLGPHTRLRRQEALRPMTQTLDAIARPNGTFAMVAMDQRESLRAMMGGDAPDERLVRFKLAVARELGPVASGFLMDRQFGYDRVAEIGPRGLMLAVDTLVQEPGGPVEDTGLDTALSEGGVEPGPAVGLKLLVIWRDDAERPRRLETARRFVELADSLGLLSVLEGIVRHEDREAAIVEAAAELSSAGPSLYKVEVPYRGRGDGVTEACRRIDEVVPMPWVVLSNGVELADFPAAVEASCRGGASGFLAGRAVWSDLVHADDPGPALRETAVPRLESLIEIVDAHGRPWREKGQR